MEGASLLRVHHPVSLHATRSRPVTKARLATGLLAFSVATFLFMQIWAGLALRGLYADGCYYAARLWLAHSFVVIEPSRWTAQMLVQMPVVLVMWLGTPSPLVVAQLFSLSTNLMPLLWTMLSFALLPRGMRAYALFPLVVYLAAGTSAAIASIADGPFAAAYLWLLLLLIAVAPPTRGRLALMLLLALGTLRLHEATAILGPILILACIWRARHTRDTPHRIILALTALLVMIGSARAVLDITHPRAPANCDAFVRDVLHLRWLVTPGMGLHVPALAGLLALLGLAAWLLARGRPRVAGAIYMLCAALFPLLAGLALLLPTAAPSAFAARGLSCLVSAPVMLILLAERCGWIAPVRPQRSITTLAALLGFTLVVADGAANAEWSGYVSSIRQVVASRAGVIPWPVAVAELSPPQAQRLQRLSWPWTTPLMSLWLAPAADPVTSLISNPPGTAWEPISPTEQHALLHGTPPSDLRQALARLKPWLAR